MNHKLDTYRLSYSMWRQALGHANSLKAAKHVKANVMSHLNKSRNRLKAEMDRIAWILYPKTGRPYMGKYMLVNTRNDQVMIIGSAAECDDMHAHFGYVHYYDIRKLHPVIV